MSVVDFTDERDPALIVAADAAPESADGLRETVRRALATTQAKIGVSLLACYVLLAVVGAIWNPQTEASIDLYQNPSRNHLLGTDSLGRDVFDRLIAGSAYIVGTSFAAAVACVAVAAFTGAFVAYRGGLIDAAFMRVVDAFLSFPTILVALLAAVLLPPGYLSLFLVTSLVQIPPVIRVSRAVFADVFSREFITVATLRGESARRLIIGEALPNVAGPLLVELSAPLELLRAPARVAQLPGRRRPAARGGLGAHALRRPQRSPDHPLGRDRPGRPDRRSRRRDQLRGRRDLACGRARLRRRREHAVIDVEQLTIAFSLRNGVFRAIRDCDLHVGSGEALAVVGESGSGKTTVARAVLGDISSNAVVESGSVRLAGNDVFAASPRELARLRRFELGYVPQNPGASLNPVRRIGVQISEITGGQSAGVGALLERVELSPALARRYPYQLSGGQQQRAALAIALANNPKALILDEPTTGLDVRVQASVLRLVRSIVDEGLAVLYVTHDLAAAAMIADRVLVMYAGAVVEEGALAEVYRRPLHPYSAALLHAVPTVTVRSKLVGIPGQMLGAGQRDGCCVFHNRCAFAIDACRTGEPAMRVFEETAQPLPAGRRARVARRARGG